MDVRFTATSLFFFLLVLAASAAAPLEVPAAVQEFHKAMTMNPYNETAVVAEGVIGAGAAGLNVTIDADGDTHVAMSNSTLFITVVAVLIAIVCCVLLLILCTWLICKCMNCKKRAEDDEERPKRAVGLTPDNEGRRHDVVVEVPETNDM